MTGVITHRESSGNNRRPLLVKESDVRYYLLIFAILGTSLYIFFSELISLPLSGPYTRCTQSVLQNPSKGLGIVEGIPPLCGVATVAQLLVGLLCGEMLVFGLAFVIYRLLPWWRRKTEGLQLLNPKEHQQLFNALKLLRLERLGETHALNRVPARLQYFTSDDNSIEPYVFGRQRRSGLFLPRAYVQAFQLTQHSPEELRQYEDAQHVIRAVLSHELAHLYNDDIGKTYFTLSIWRAFCVIALAPYAVFSLAILFTSPNAGTSFAVNGLIRVALMALIVYLIRAGILRSRELEADAQAKAWSSLPGEREYLAEILGRAALPRQSASWIARINQTIRSIFDDHPDVQERQTSLSEDQSRLSFNYWQAFGIGLTFGTAFPPIYITLYFLNQLLTYWGFGIPFVDYNNGYAQFPDAGMLALCMLLVFALTQMIWQVVSGASDDMPLRGAGRMGLALAAGLLIGFVTSLFFTSFVGLFQLHDVRVFLVFVLPWPIIVGVGFWGFSRWLTLLIKLWKGALRTKGLLDSACKTPWGMRTAIVISFLGASVLLAVSLTILVQLLTATLAFLLPLQPSPSPTNQTITLQPSITTNYYFTIGEILFILFLRPYYMTATLAGFWVLPAFATLWSKWTWRRQHAQSAGSAHVVTGQYPLCFGEILRVTCIAIPIFAIVYSLLDLTLSHYGLLSISAFFGPWGVFLVFGPIFLAVLFQAVIAVVLFARTQPNGVLNGLFGAFLSGNIMSFLMFGVYRLMEKNNGPDTFTDLYVYCVNWGVVYAAGTIVVAVIMVTTKRWQAFVGGMTSLTLVVALVWLAQPQLAPTTAGIVKNGDFEHPTVDMAQGQTAYTAGQSFANWTVASGTASLVGTFIWQADQGAQSLDLPGNQSAVYQDLATTPGKTYTLRFALAGDPTCLPLIKTVQVWWGTTPVATYSFNISGHVTEKMGWQPHVKTVQALTSTTRLQFKSLISSACGPAIDNVSVTG